MFTFLKILIGLAVLAFLVGTVRMWQIEHSANQKLFARGDAPNPEPAGFYKGSFSRPVSWLGKKFDATDSSGVNVFGTEGAKIEKYPFKTKEGKGLRDKIVSVLKIDYNISGNPLWLRLILDEIVETEPGKYLGKIHLRIIPGYPFTLGYFTLQK
jgi:hypothetical protein